MKVNTAEKLLIGSLCLLFGAMIGITFSFNQFSYIALENERLEAEVEWLATIYNNKNADYNLLANEYMQLHESYEIIQELVDYIIESCNCKDLDSNV